ncbi:MAG: acyl-CoA dehydrogenase [Candidatus Tectimicrobiota bacterium]
MKSLAAQAVRPLTVLSEEETLLRSTIRHYADTTLAPLVTRMDETAHYDPALISGLFALGIMGLEIPEQYGGAGGSFFMACLAVEEISRVDPAVGVLVDVHNTLFTNALLRWGSPEQQARYCPRLVRDTIGAYSLSEAGSGSDAFALQTRATLEGDYYVLNGRKLWTSNGREAGIYIVFATVDPSQGYRGITAFLVERESPGLRLGRAEKKLGIRASSTCELLLDNCMVPRANVLGEVGRGYRVAIETLNEGRIGIGAQMVGLADGALQAALRYAKQRQQFGKPLAAFQAMQFQLAEMATQLEAARLLVYNAARLKDAGAPFLQQAAMAKYFASQMAEQVASKAVEVFGGLGFTQEAPVEKFYRDAKIGAIYEGTSFMQLNTIARQLLDEPSTAPTAARSTP